MVSRNHIGPGGAVSTFDPPTSRREGLDNMCIPSCDQVTKPDGNRDFRLTGLIDCGKLDCRARRACLTRIGQDFQNPSKDHKHIQIDSDTGTDAPHRHSDCFPCRGTSSIERRAAKRKLSQQTGAPQIPGSKSCWSGSRFPVANIIHSNE